MKFTLSWLKEHLKTTASAAEIAAKLTAIGLELESLDDPSERLKPFVISEIKTAAKHPNADKLQVCAVDVGGETVQVVCGAPNARKGLRAVLARPGTYVPGIDATLKPGVIRGEKSQGMLCSAAELEIPGGHDGIIELPSDAPVGASFAEWAGLNDPVFEINLTPNRGDCAGVRGIARDLTAAGLGELLPNRTGIPAGKGKSPVSVRIDCDAELCPVFAYRIIRGVKNGPSPAWLQNRLTAIGLRPISALVDVTNLMTMDQCRPMHVFDAARLEGDLVVRLARSDEKLAALNEREYVLGDGMVVIADQNGPVSLAGIMGGEPTGCTKETTDVLVESAVWQPANIARTGRKLDIHSDARFRFERGTDASAVIAGMEIATKFIVDFCGGEPGEIQLAGAVPQAAQVESFRLGQVQALGGLELDESACLKILHDLGFQTVATQQKGIRQIQVPHWRSDIQSESDFVEEIARIHGYDSIPSVSMDRDGPLPEVAFEEIALQKRKVRRALAAAGMSEAVTWSFLAAEAAELFGELRDELYLENPMSIEMNYMRSTLLTNLLTAASRNADRGYPDVQLFEIGTIFEGVQPEQQKTAAAAVRMGTHPGKHWRTKPRQVDVFDAKRDAMLALRAAGAPAEGLQTAADSPPYFHPGRSGSLVLGRTVLAHFGELHPRVLKGLGIKHPVVGMEMFFAALPAKRSKSSTTRPFLELAPFQPIERDFAFLVDSKVTAESVLKSATSADRKLIVGGNLFDVYEGQGVPDGKKSLAISVTIQPRESSMKEAEIDAICQKVVAQVAAKTGGSLRV